MMIKNGERNISVKMCSTSLRIEPGRKTTGFFYVQKEEEVNMQFLIVVLIVRLIITLAENKTKTKNTIITRSEAKDPAAFPLR
jgi:hypothetical protein